ncbi:MAG TPA: HEAT repeat domain-containing protein [Actinomycetota bacterium]
MDPAGAPSLGLSELRAALASPDPGVRARAIRRARPEPGVQEALIEALRDASADVRRATVRALARLQGPRATRALIQVSTGDLSVSVRAEAVAALGKILEARATDEGGPCEGQDPAD